MHSDHSRRSATGARLVAAALLAFLVACSAEQYPQSTLHPSADQSNAIDGLFRQIVWWAVVVFVLVEGALVVAVIRFRRRPGQPEPRQVYGNTLVEVAWTLAPAVILVFIAVPTVRTLFRVDGRAGPDALQVEVIGHQWWWEYRYPELGIVTANELVLPQGREVALSLTSADVIHSFWPPKLAGKRDAQPGRITRLAFSTDSIGTFLGQCAEFCGASHANMRLRVIVQSPSDFEAWAARQAQPTPVDSGNAAEMAGLEAFRRIREPANHSCLVCHTVAGISGGLAGPSLTHVGSRQTIAGAILPNDSAGLARWLRDPPGEKPGSLMPRVALTDDEIAALVAFLRARR